jgi:hypothetical protein
MDARRSVRRRLEDQIESLYNRSRKINDLEAASDLLALLERWFARRMAKAGQERRINGFALQRARRELNKTCARRSRP